MSEYDPLSWEKHWQQYWTDNHVYRFDPMHNNVYSIDNPPRYASGALHIGHAVHYTHIDFVARYKRMQGYNVFFPLCFDVNGIPIEERVEKQEGITRKDIDRHEFIKLCRNFAEKNIDEMKRQFVMLGESMDSSIYYRTDAEYYRRITQISFIDLYNKGHIYKGEFPVNWCPRCMTAMADAEIEHTNRKTTLNTVKFYFSQEQPEQIEKYHGIGRDEQGQYIEIATTRPEMLPTCQIVAIHPEDDRVPWLVNQQVRVPLFEHLVAIIEDESVDPQFGSGMLMVCTIGDKDDLDKALRLELPMKICIDEEGRMNSLAKSYQGMPIFEARQAVIDDLCKKGMVIKQEEIEQSVGICWRCKTPAEFIQAEQWFLKLIPLKEKILGAADSINWHPEYMQLRLDEWVKSLKWDWVISRQRYFATPIPLWECETCDAVVLAEKEQCYVDPTIDQPPVNVCPECGGSLKGSEDVFDTWMDSSVTPLYNTFWERDLRLFKCMYPMSLRPQAHDIIRTWAFYTILRCLLITGQKPFDEIMMGGFILAPDGKPMHTSLGNVIDPLEILQKDGADPLRYYAAKCKLGEDNPFRPKDLVRGKRLMKKLWSVQRFIGMILDKNEDFHPHQPLRDNALDIMDLWILTRYSKTITRCTDYLDKFAYSEAIREAEQFLWHEVADHYIEMVKHRVYDQFDEQAITVLYTLGLGILKLLAPFLPHITEELFQSSYQPYEKEISLHTTPWPRPVLEDHAGEQAGELIKNIISIIRDWKSSQGMPLNATIEAVTIIAHKEMDGLNRGSDTISQTLNIHKLSFSDKLPTTVREVINVEPIHAIIGPQFKNNSPAVINELLHHPNEIAAALNDKSEYSFTHNNEIITITPEHVNIVKHYKGDKTAIINMENIIIAVEA